MQDARQTRLRLIALEIEHRDLDAAVDAMIQTGRVNELQLRRLKKRKLQLKDQILQLEMQLVPDILA